MIHIYILRIMHEYDTAVCGTVVTTDGSGIEYSVCTAKPRKKKNKRREQYLPKGAKAKAMLLVRKGGAEGKILGECVSAFDVRGDYFRAYQTRVYIQELTRQRRSLFILTWSA